MKVTRQQRGEVTRQAILEAAERLFAEVGFAAARLEDVAEEVGIRRPSIIYYFASKQELYDEVEASIFAEMHRVTQARVAGQARRQNLDRDRAIEARVARAIDLAHSAGTNGCDDLVWPQARSADDQ